MLVPDSKKLLGFVVQKVRETPIVRQSALGTYVSSRGYGFGIHPIEPDYSLVKPRKARIIPLSSGDKGTRETLLKMKELALAGARHPDIWELSRKTVRGCPVKDTNCEAQKMLKWIHDNVRWTPDIGNAETVAAPWRTISVGGGDCDDVATLLASMAVSIGMPARFKAIAANPEYKNEFTHVYTELKVGNKWIPAEPSIKGMPLGWESPVIYRKMIQDVWNGEEE